MRRLMQVADEMEQIFERERLLRWSVAGAASSVANASTLSTTQSRAGPALARSAGFGKAKQAADQRIHRFIFGLPDRR